MEQYLIIKETKKRDGYTQWYEEPNLESNSSIYDNFTEAVKVFRDELLAIKKNKIVKFNKSGCIPCVSFLNDLGEAENDEVDVYQNITKINEMIVETVSDSKYRIKDVLRLDIDIIDNTDWHYAFKANKDILFADYSGVSIRTNVHNIKGSNKIYYFTYQNKGDDNEVISEINLRLVPIGKHTVINDNPRNSLKFTYKTFGRYYQDYEGKELSPIVWIEIGKKNGKKFLISEKVLDHKQFDKFTNDWKDSELRKWLNSDFYNICFNDDEKKNIISNEDGDKVSLLTEDECNKYFEQMLELSTVFTKYAQSRAEDNYGRRYIPLDYAFWWLRTEGEPQSLYHVCNDGGLNGFERHHYKDGVRPVIIINEE